MFDDYITTQDTGGVGCHVTFLDASGEPLGTQPRTVFVSVHGSHLYGTSGPQSDVDLKAIYLNDASDIILEEAEKNQRWSTEEEKNGPEDVDIEAIELRKFVKDALDGQTYAVELLFTPYEMRLVGTSVWNTIVANREELLSQNTKPFMGYCKTQAKKYSIKGQRLSVIEDVLETLDGKPPGDPVEAHLSDLPLDSEYVECYKQTIKNQDEPVDMIDVVGKKFELHSPLRKMYESMQSTHSKYGKRAHRSKDGVDWKAVSHAYRVAFELIELLTDGRLTFPRPRADFLKRAKHGKLDYTQVQEDIPEWAEKALNTESELPETPNRSFWREWLVDLYQHYVFS